MGQRSTCGRDAEPGGRGGGGARRTADRIARDNVYSLRTPLSRESGEAEATIEGICRLEDAGASAMRNGI